MKIKFYLLPYVSPSDASDSLEAVALGEGLRELGITYYANIDFFPDPITNQYLFTKAPEGFEADVNVYYNTFLFMRNPEVIPQIDYSKINILVDRSDELVPFWQLPEYEFLKKFDLLLVDHVNNQQHYPAGYHYKPWQIGFPQRVIDYNEKYKNQPIESIILDSFRLHHNIRLLAIDQFSKGLKDIYPTENRITDKIEDNDVKLDEVDRAYWRFTGKRHNPFFFKDLNSALLTYVFGGFYHYKPATFTFADKFIRYYYRAKARLDNALGRDAGPNYFIYQWDSYRLWEALVANTCPIFLDFEHWGFELPVMPINGVHYIGVKSFDFQTTIEQIRKMSREEILKIGQAGKQWAIDNYGPVAVAQRLMDEVKQLEKYKRTTRTSKVS